MREQERGRPYGGRARGRARERRTEREHTLALQRGFWVAQQRYAHESRAESESG